MDNHVHDYYPIFSYFATQLGQPLSWWEDKKVLDFGGNWGNVLRDPNCTIKPENYHCLDVSQAALENGNAAFPEAHWHLYNRFNLVYNFKGVKGEPLPTSVTDQKFDVILVFSVFTTTSVTEMQETIGNELMPLLNPGGVLMTTYLSLDAQAPLSFFLQKRLGFQEKLKLSVRNKFKGRWYGYLVGSANVLFKNEGLEALTEQHLMLAFHKDEFIKAVFPTCTIKRFVSPEIQHCIIIEAPQ